MTTEEFEASAEDGTWPVIGWRCTTCKKIFGVGDTGRMVARFCCTRRSTCDGCGGVSREGWTNCESCSEKQAVAKEKERFNLAVKIPEANYEGWVYYEGAGDNEGCFQSVEELREWAESEGVDLPEHVWAARSDQFVTASIDRVLDIASENACEDWDGHAEGEAALMAAIEKFNVANEDQKVYRPDFKLAVLLEHPLKSEI